MDQLPPIGAEVPQALHPDWFSANAPKTGSDWFTTHAPKTGLPPMGAEVPRKVYLDDQGNPIAATPKVYLNDQGEPIARSTLATRVRAKFPGAYDDLDDATLERQVLAKHPEYQDLATPPKTDTPPASAFIRFTSGFLRTLPQVQTWPAAITAAVRDPIGTLTHIGQASAEQQLWHPYRSALASGFGPVSSAAGAGEQVFDRVRAGDDAGAAGSAASSLGQAALAYLLPAAMGRLRTGGAAPAAVASDADTMAMIVQRYGAKAAPGIAAKLGIAGGEAPAETRVPFNIAEDDLRHPNRQIYPIKPAMDVPPLIRTRAATVPPPVTSSTAPAAAPSLGSDWRPVVPGEAVPPGGEFRMEDGHDVRPELRP